VLNQPIRSNFVGAKMNRQLHTLGRRAFYLARKSAVLRRAVALPGLAGLVNRICGRILQTTSDYPQWMQRRLLTRRGMYTCVGEPGLLSFLTTVYNTPTNLLQPAIDSLLRNQTVTQFQWVVLDNGSTDPGVIAHLKQAVAEDPRVVFFRVEENLGIVGGMHLALSRATGEYVLPFDSDDLLYPDAVEILTHQLRAHGFPPAMYSDEDKLQNGIRCWPYFKPDWDPVLFLNSCYIAHLGCIQRRLANELGMYTDRQCNGCHDWDSFTRLMLAGQVPVHIPEMLYTWRMHTHSTAGNVRSKNYIYQSQKNLLEQYLTRTGRANEFEIDLSPLFPGTPDWRLRRTAAGSMPAHSILLREDQSLKSTRRSVEPSLIGTTTLLGIIDGNSDVRLALAQMDDFSGLVLITCDSLKLESDDWRSEVTGLFERFPDAVMIGGRVMDTRDRVVDAGRVPGFGGVFGCPDKGRDRADPGNLAELWKQRSVSGVSTQLCVIQAEFLKDIVVAYPGHKISWRFLGAWASLLAYRQMRRVIFTPFLSGVCDLDPDQSVSIEEQSAFATEAGAFLADRRYYSRYFGNHPASAFHPTYPA
jgi:glycosyltransferase involved in cell wall biosynthesis